MNMTLQEFLDTVLNHTAVGDALWERVMEGDPSAVADYARWMEDSQKIYGLGVAAL